MNALEYGLDMPEIPKSQELIKPLLRVLNSRGVLSNAEIRQDIERLLELSDEARNLIHSGSRSELEYRLAWARTNAKSKGLIESPKREHWQITELGKMRVQ